MEIGILIVIIGIAAIVYMFVAGEVEHRKKKRKDESYKPRKICQECRYFQPMVGGGKLGNCSFFFKTFYPWSTGCHRWEEKGGFDED